MKYLTVIRHAKSSWDHPTLADHDRPLNNRGQKAAPAMARFVHQTYLGGTETPPLLPFPDRLISSTALRALATAQILREELKLPTEKLELQQQLYLASEDTLLRTVHQFDESWVHAFIVGHNPGLHDFINRLLARAKVAQLPTCAVTILALPADHWALSDWNEAQLVGHITPRMLERRFPDLYHGISNPTE